MRSGPQLPLFGDEEASTPAPREPPDPLVGEHEAARRLADLLPPGVKFGTSSWSFPGWRGLVFAQATPTATLARDGLRDYSRHPLLTTVGVDRSYYAPVSDEELRHYSTLVPASFGACFKAPAAVTSAVVPAFRAGTTRPAPNPDYFSLERLESDLLAPLDRSFATHTDLVILEFPPVPSALGLEVAAFLDRLDSLLERLPRAFRYAVELREPRFLTAAYRRILDRHGVGHTYNYWARMPMPAEQRTQVPLRAGVPACVRLLMRPGTTYEAQREAFKPFNRIVEADLRMRRDVVSLVKDAAGRQIPLCVLVNNKAEGSAPLTIRALAEAVAAACTR